MFDARCFKAEFMICVELQVRLYACTLAWYKI